MKLSHVVYKVNNLSHAVEQFRNDGFHVEYGSKINPHNALIYFSEGPYIELVEESPLTWYARLILIIIGKRKTVERLDHWGSAEEGLVDLCLENYNNDLEEEIQILKKYNLRYFKTTSKRNDPKDRLLNWKLLFPDNLQLPFLMTYFNIDPKPDNFIHPNGVRNIKSVSYGTSKELMPVVEELCDDSALILFEGNGLKDLVYEKEA